MDKDKIFCDHMINGRHSPDQWVIFTPPRNICRDFPVICKFYGVFPADIAEKPLNYPVNPCEHGSVEPKTEQDMILYDLVSNNNNMCL